jgi:hypothetical protein
MDTASIGHLDDFILFIAMGNQKRTYQGHKASSVLKRNLPSDAYIIVELRIGSLVSHDNQHTC